MTELVLTVPPETTVRKAANLMRGRSFGRLVVANAGRVLGIVTVSDFLELIGRGLDCQAEKPPRDGRSSTRPPSEGTHGGDRRVVIPVRLSAARRRTPSR